MPEHKPLSTGRPELDIVGKWMMQHHIPAVGPTTCTSLLNSAQKMKAEAAKEGNEAIRKILLNVADSFYVTALVQGAAGLAVVNELGRLVHSAEEATPHAGDPKPEPAQG
jgi:hypothetical protein